MPDSKSERLEVAIKECQDEIRGHDTWIANHDGRINAWWDAQHKWNAMIDIWRDGISKRLNRLEWRVAWIAGVAATVGALLGSWFDWKG